MLIRHTLLVAVLLAATVATAQTTQPLAPLQSIAALDVPRYMGRWFEIAKLPNWFQRKCLADTSATYPRRPKHAGGGWR